MSAELIPIRPITTAAAPQQNISPREIAAPFNTLSEGFDKLGDAAEATAVTLAKDAGRDAVRTDDAGNLVVDKAPIVGPASQVYENAALTSGLAKIKPKIENDLLEMRLSDPYNFDKFKASADAYRTKLMGGIDNPHLRDAVGDVVAANSAHNWRTMRVEADQKNVADFVSDSQATLKDITEKRSSLARQGGVWLDKDGNLQSTPEFLGLTKDYQRIIGNLVNDPRTKYSTERAALEIKQQGAADFVQMKIGEVQRQFMDDKDLPKARQALANAFWGPGSEKWNLTATQRDHGVAEGTHAITNLSAVDHEAITENRKAVAGWMTDTVTKPRSFDLGSALNLKQRAKDIGDARSEHEIDETIKFQPFAQAYHSASPEGRSEMLAEIKRGVMPAYRLQSSFQKMLDEAPPEIRQSISVFSGTRTPEHQAELYAAAVKKYGSEEEARKWVAPPGHSQHEKGNAADLRFDSDAARQWVHANAGNYGLAFPLANEPWHVEMADARGGKGPIEGQRIDLSAASPTARLFENVTKDLTSLVSKDAESALARIEKNAKEGATILPDDVQHFAEMASRSGRDDLLEKARPWLSAVDINAGRPAGQTLDVLKGQIAELRAKGIDPMAADTLDHVEAIGKAQDERFKANPQAGGAEKGWVGAPQQFTLNNPAADGANFAARQKNINVIQQPDHIPNLGPISAVMPSEAPQIASMLTQGDPKAAAGFLAGMQANLSPEVWRKTMAMPEIKDAMLSMMNSNDPARMDAAATSLDKLWGTNEPDFGATYGQKAVERLMAWKGLQAFSGDERVMRMNRADDPYQKISRQDIGEKVATEMKAWTPSDVAYQMSNAWPIISHALNPITHQFLRPPTLQGGEEGVAAGALQAEFAATVKQLRMADVPAAQAPTLAAQTLKSQWQPSPMLGYSLMKHAPEAYYPADPITQNRDWMGKQLIAEITALHGPQETPISAGDFEGGAGMMAPGWKLKSIIADNQTEREIEAGNPNPSYQIHIIDAKGQDQLVGGAGKRYFWDKDRMLNAAQSEMNVAGNRESAPYQTIGQGSPFMSRMSNPTQPNAMDKTPPKEAPKPDTLFDPVARDYHAQDFKEQTDTLDRREMALKKSGLGGAFFEAQMKRITAARADVEKQRNAALR